MLEESSTTEESEYSLLWIVRPICVRVRKSPLSNIHGGERRRPDDERITPIRIQSIEKAKRVSITRSISTPLIICLCPAMATQYERVFSAARRTLAPERNALGPGILEACEYLWW
jgi:hypothetical protein